MELASEDQPDGELLGRYFEGDPAAFDLLTGRWRGRLARYFLNFGFGYEDVEDLIQETVVKLFLLRDDADFDRERPLDGYMLRMARNLALNARRRRREMPVPPEELQDAIDRPNDARDDSELAEDLSWCLSALPEEARTVLLECGKHGLGEASHDAIAAARRKWPSQVSGLCQRARVLMRVCLSRKGYR